MNGKRDDPARAMGEGYTLLGVGITFALTLTGFALLGYWVDGRVGTIPLFTIVGTLLGAGLGGYWMYVRVRAEERGSGDGE